MLIDKRFTIEKIGFKDFPKEISANFDAAIERLFEFLDEYPRFSISFDGAGVIIFDTVNCVIEQNPSSMGMYNNFSSQAFDFLFIAGWDFDFDVWSNVIQKPFVLESNQQDEIKEKLEEVRFMFESHMKL